MIIYICIYNYNNDDDDDDEDGNNDNDNNDDNNYNNNNNNNNNNDNNNSNNIYIDIIGSDFHQPSDLPFSPSFDRFSCGHVPRQGWTFFSLGNGW
jgi:hypothetical protein